MMQTMTPNAVPSLNEWASFFNQLSSRRNAGEPFLTRDQTAQRLISNLEVKLPAIRKYQIGRQLRLFAS